MGTGNSPAPIQRSYQSERRRSDQSVLPQGRFDPGCDRWREDHSPSIAIVHDYLTQRGGAERVLLSIAKAFPAAPVHTSLFLPEGTFPGFAPLDVRPSPLNGVRTFRRHHRLAFPVLAPAMSRLTVDADIVLCSSSGWAHGVRVSGRKVVYCHAPARWLYQPGRYLGRHCPRVAALALSVLAPHLRRWDRAAAHSADHYLTNSRAVRSMIREIYGIEATVLPPPHSVDPHGVQRPVECLDDGYYLCVSRLLPYKNVDAVVEAFSSLRSRRLVVVGQGPDAARLRAAAGPNVRFLERVDDAELRWLYAHTAGLVSASYEDFGLTPLEAAAFGRPSAVLRFGGYLDTVRPGVTGIFFDRPYPSNIMTAVKALDRWEWDPAAIKAHANDFSEEAFVSRLREEVYSVAHQPRAREMVSA